MSTQAESTRSEASEAKQEPPYWMEKAGVTPIKSEYVLWDKIKNGQGDRKPNDDDAAEAGTSRVGKQDRSRPSTSTSSDQAAVAASENGEGQDGIEPEHKKARLSGAEKRKVALAKQTAPPAGAEGGDGDSGAKRQSGQNKGRVFNHSAGTGGIRLCNNVAQGSPCRKPEGQCRWSHDISAYMAQRIADIRSALPTSAEDLSPADSVRRCPSFDSLGKCTDGIKCRFGSAHIRQVEPGAGFQGSEWELVQDVDKIRLTAEQLGPKASDKGEYNLVDMPTIKLIRGGQGATKKERFPLSVAYLTSIGEELDSRDFGGQNSKKDRGSKRQRQGDPKVFVAVDDYDQEPEPESASRTFVPDMAQTRPLEKKKLSWQGKLYMPALTTVGALPFRRLAVSYGCDITVGEMALAQELLSGNSSEFSLLRRHPSEKEFGVQICGSRPQTMTMAAEAIVQHCDVDFIGKSQDLPHSMPAYVNCGCPIDLVFNKGAGSALLAHANKLGKCLVGMNRVLGEIPVSLKIRTGVAANSPMAHKLMPRLQKEWGVSAITMHGRSRAQRYSKLADYDYIGECVKVLRDTAKEDNLEPIPFFGNGDAYDWRTYHENLEATKADGVAIARGALIKPWIFTEIKERRDWDISATERLEMIGKLTDFGLEHFGSDQIGVNHVRRFVCESLSFTHRYVPVGLLEKLPAKLNERPLPYKGRNELETLLASDQSRDWVKITEMFLGPAPSDWSFKPKHKSSATGQEADAQG
ncbi:BQ5605_C034g11263 [Microbotryum silenes-dioicae]|uniref:tRNA-dihydrouridine(47) synthase [NAD(P)(+)] n=1 Tax=Microbotryum silenes-dioicae TaxID=796604 RepID=A0A2X0N2K7_9BASI|nr:BQ5605_C034g11263 [Microbotryum silenes-dioicae]